MNLKTIIKSELLFESLEDRLKSAYVKWCKKTKSKRQQTVDNIYDADGYVEELDVYSSDFGDPYSEMYQKAEELYAKEDYEGILKMIVDHQCRGGRVDWEFKEWLSYRNLMKSSDIFQYKNEEELKVELWNAKEKSFTKKLKKASAGEDFDKIWENDDMLIVVPKSHVGACKFGQGTKWCTASKTNNYFDSYYKKGILYRVLQKNDNYKELFSNFQMGNKRSNYDIENLSKVSINLSRKQNDMSMVDKVDKYFGDKPTLEFLNSLPSEGYKAIKNYQSLNEQNIIREEMDDFDWVRDIPNELPKDRDWWIINDVDPYSSEVSAEIQDFMFKQGFTWLSGRENILPKKIVAIAHRGGTYDKQLGKFGFYNAHHHSVRDVENYEIEDGDLFYYWSKITKPIKESDDMDWIRDIEPTDSIGDFLMKKFHEKMVAYLSLGGRKGDIISREWATVEAFLIELKELKENGFVNYLSRILLQSHVDRPYPHILKAIEDTGFDVNKSEETQRLYKKFQSYNSLGSKIKRSLKKIIGEELIKESGVENYLQSIASITSGNQKKYYDWLLSNLEKVPVVSYRSNEELKDKIDSFVKRMRRTGSFCEKKGCFDTAYNTAMYVPGVHYIEGYVQSMIPLVHAWNYLPEEGIYFDLINDIAWEEEDSHFNEYYKIIDLDMAGVVEWSSKTGYGGGFLESPQFVNHILKQ